MRLGLMPLSLVFIVFIQRLNYLSFINVETINMSETVLVQSTIFFEQAFSRDNSKTTDQIFIQIAQLEPDLCECIFFTLPFYHIAYMQFLNMHLLYTSFTIVVI